MNTKHTPKNCPICGGELTFHRFDFTERQYQDTEKCGLRCSGCESLLFVETIEIRYDRGNAWAKWDLVEAGLWDKLVIQSPDLLKSVNDLTIERDELLGALEASKARLEGDFDNPSLIKFGMLSSINEDILLIIKSAINKAKKGL